MGGLALEEEVNMKQVALVAGLILVLAGLAAAQESAEAPETATGEWNVSSEFNLTLTQNAYSENWSGGESGAVSWAANSLSKAENQLTASLNSATTLKLAFGQTHSQDPETNEWKRPVKSTDLIDLESVLKLTMGWSVDPYVSGRMETRFLDERDPANSRAFNPMQLTESAGIARTLIKDEKTELGVRLGGAIRQHIDRDAIAEGAETKETITTSDAGVEFVSEYKTSVAEDRIGIYSKLTAYNALYDSEKDEPETTDDWKSVDLNWENTFTADITSFLMVNLYVQLLYDKQVDDGLMFKETLSLGFTFQLL
jgi:hypothetical protein